MKKGDKIYIPSQLHISRGSDDIAGGLATINKLIDNPNLPDGHYNKTMVSLEETSGHSYNLNYLKENQEKWSKEYAGKIAHPDPDIDTPWIEDGDFVNGKVYHGPSIM